MEQNIDDINLFKWYTYNDSNDRSYGYTTLYPIAKKLSSIKSVILVAIKVTNTDGFRPIDSNFEVVWIEDEESLTEWYDKTISKNEMIETIFGKIDDEMMGRIRNMLK